MSEELHVPEQEPDHDVLPEWVANFNAVRNPNYQNILLMKCRLFGQPNVAICVTKETGPDTVGMIPMFVAVTMDMDLRDSDGQAPDAIVQGEGFEVRNKVDASHPTLPVSLWVEAVVDGKTRLGYWAWVQSEITAAWNEAQKRTTALQ